MKPGDSVEWTNGSYISETHGCGEIVFIHDDWIVIINHVTAARTPHIAPFITKRPWELRLVAKAA